MSNVNPASSTSVPNNNTLNSNTVNDSTVNANVDSKSSVSDAVDIHPINPKAATKANEDMLRNMAKFTPIDTTESGKSVYSPEDEDKILAQFNELLDQGYNLTMSKKALAIHHNINTGTIDSWRQDNAVNSEASIETSSNSVDVPYISPDNDIEISDELYFEVVQKKLNSIDEELRKFDQKVQEAKELLANEDKIRKEIEAKKETYFPPAFKAALGDK